MKWIDNMSNVDEIMKDCRDNIFWIESSWPERFRFNAVKERLEECYKNCYIAGEPVDLYDIFQQEPSYVKKLESSYYIIDSEPDLTDVDEIAAKKAWEHLLDVKEKGGGITEEEARLILDWDVQKVRFLLNINEMTFTGFDIRSSSLFGDCGGGQAYSLAFFQKAGLKVTINQAEYFAVDSNGTPRFSLPINPYGHGFGTVTFPIVDNEGTVTDKQYLIDTTYRQFFSLVYCHEGLFVSKTDSGPFPGYYLINYLDGIEIAREILKKGYIEMTPEVLKKYAGAFVVASARLRDKEKIDKIFSEIKFEEFKRILEECQVEIDFDSEDIDEFLEYFTFTGNGFGM